MYVPTDQHALSIEHTAISAVADPDTCCTCKCEPLKVQKQEFASITLPNQSLDLTGWLALSCIPIDRTHSMATTIDNRYDTSRDAIQYSSCCLTNLHAALVVMSSARKLVLAVDHSEECKRALSWLKEHLYKP